MLKAFLPPGAADRMAAGDVCSLGGVWAVHSVQDPGDDNPVELCLIRSDTTQAHCPVFSA